MAANSRDFPGGHVLDDALCPECGHFSGHYHDGKIWNDGTFKRPTTLYWCDTHKLRWRALNASGLQKQDLQVGNDLKEILGEVAGYNEVEGSPCGALRLSSAIDGLHGPAACPDCGCAGKQLPVGHKTWCYCEDCGVRWLARHSHEMECPHDEESARNAKLLEKFKRVAGSACTHSQFMAAEESGLAITQSNLGNLPAEPCPHCDCESEYHFAERQQWRHCHRCQTRWRCCEQVDAHHVQNPDPKHVEFISIKYRDVTPDHHRDERCHVCRSYEYHYYDEAGGLWLFCQTCKHRWRWHSDTNRVLFKGPVAEEYIRDVVVKYPDVTPEGWQDRAPPKKPAAPPQSQREQLIVPRVIQPMNIDAEKPWQGTTARKPWEYRATAVIPHRNTPEHLELCLQFIQQQAERPYIMVIDTGSDDASLQRVLALRSESVEVHQVACHGTEDRVDAVCYAMDLALSACRTEYLWCVHSDCFVINRNLLADLLAKSEGGKHPVIGYESSSANRHVECRGMVSHTCTLLHVPTMDRLDVTWSMRRLQQQMQDAGLDVVSDTEMALNYRMRDRGVTPLILGAEQVSGVERDANRVHLRSTTLTADVLSAMPGARDANDVVFAELRSMAGVPNPPQPLRAGSPIVKPTTFQLLYHVTPLSTNDVWRRNVSLLLRYLHVFNGRKVVAITQGRHGDAIYPSHDVEQLFAGHDVKFIHVPNDPEIRESASFLALLEQGFNASPEIATFYGHTKGLAHPSNRAVTMWYRSLYTNCLGDVERVATALSRVSCCGAFRRIGQQPNFPPYSQWHFSGTFFWFRNDRLYMHPRWRDVDRTKYGTEAYLSKLFRLEDSECLFCDDAGDLYDINYWNSVVIPTAHAESLRA